MPLIDICAKDDVADGESLLVEADGLTLAIHNVDGELFATDDHCTHGPGSLSEGELEGHVIVCDFHQGRFDVRTGEVVAPPPWEPVRTYPVVVEGGRVLVEADDAAVSAGG